MALHEDGGRQLTPDQRARALRLLALALGADTGHTGAWRDDEDALDHSVAAQVTEWLDTSPPEDFLASIVPEPARPWVSGMRIGRYTLGRIVGKGGMGVVYEARDEVLGRQVALKRIRPERLTAQTRARFAREVQSLARLEHEGIARVFEAGEHEGEDGAHPYLVMELVHGMTLLEHAHALEYGTRARVELGIHMCDAVQHAHSKGVIHRDLKPANVLVSSSGAVKIVDFGIARLVDSDQPQVTQTEAGVLGTPSYMSPEQIGVVEADVDTRTDVYSLGVVVYELLSGRTPFGEEGDHPLRKLERMKLRDACPLRDANVAISKDLEAVVAQATEVEPKERYATVSEFAADLRRELEGEPVLARPRTTAYVLRRFVGRHRVAVAAAAAVLFSLVVGVVVAAAGWRSAAMSAAEATRARADVLDFNDVLVRAMALLNPRNGGPEEGEAFLLTTLSDAREQLADRPEALAARLLATGRSLAALGRYAGAIPPIEEAIAIYSDAPGDHEAAELEATTEMAFSLREVGRWDEAEARYRTAREGYRRLQGDEGPETVLTNANLVQLSSDRGDYEDAMQLAEVTLEQMRRTFGDSSQEVLTMMQSIANLHARQGNLEEARAWMEDQLAQQIALTGEDSINAWLSKANLAGILASSGKPDEAARLLEEVVEALRLKFGDLHPEVLANVSTLAVVRFDQERKDEAFELLRSTHATACKAMGTTDLRALTLEATLGDLLIVDHRLGEARELLERLLARQREVFGSDHPDALLSMRNLSAVYESSGDWALGADLAAERLMLLGDRHGDDHVDVVEAAATLDRLERKLIGED